jgi:hypothetical protein
MGHFLQPFFVNWQIAQILAAMTRGRRAAESGAKPDLLIRRRLPAPD